MPKSPWENREYARISLAHVDERFLSGTEQEVDFLERELALTPGARVLDLGCGAGRHAIELAKRGYDVVGIDISPTMLEAATKRAEEAGVRVAFRQGDLACLDQYFPKEAGRFNGAICFAESAFGTLGGTAKDLFFLMHVYALLNVGSKLIITTFNGLRRYRRYKSSNKNFNITTGVLRWQAPVNGGRTFLEEDQRLYTPSELSMMLQISGFDDINVYGCSPGHFHGQELEIEDIEMMVVGRRGDAGRGDCLL